MGEYGKNKNGNVYITYSVLAWSLLYIIFKFICNKILRKRNVCLLQRDRIIHSLWSWCFHLIGLFYLKFYHLSDVPSTSPEKLTNLYLIYFLMKGYCLHFAGVKIFICDAWMTGLTYLLFICFVFNNFNDCFNPYILYVFSIKIVDILILEACRFLFILWKDNCGNVFSKFLFVIHCVYWIYMYFYFIPTFLLSPEKEIKSSKILYFYLWYSFECLDSMWIKLFKFSKKEPWLKMYLFSPIKESARLMDVYRRCKQGHSSKYSSHGMKKKLDLRKTVKCAIAMKKTINRIRKAQREQMLLLKKTASESQEVQTEQVDEIENESSVNEQNTDSGKINQNVEIKETEEATSAQNQVTI